MQGTFQKLRNTTPIFPIYILNINICCKKQTFISYKQSDPQYHTRFKTNLHPPTANTTKFQKAVHYSAIKIFKNLPHEIKDLANDILPFRNALKRFLLTNSFYNSKKYFN